MFRCVCAHACRPQALETAQRLLRSGRLHAVQVELNVQDRRRYTSVAQNAEHAQRTVAMLSGLEAAGFELRQIPHAPKRAAAPERQQASALGGDTSDPWSVHQWPTLPPFPSENALNRLAQLPRATRHVEAMGHEFPRASTAARFAAAIAWDRPNRNAISTNIVGRLPHRRRGGTSALS